MLFESSIISAFSQTYKITSYNAFWKYYYQCLFSNLQNYVLQCFLEVVLSVNFLKLTKLCLTMLFKSSIISKFPQTYKIMSYNAF